MTFSHFLCQDVVSLKTEQIQKVNEDDSCLYSSDERAYFLKTKMTDSQS